MQGDPLFGPSVVSGATLYGRTDDYEAGGRSGEWGVDETRCNRTYTNRLKLLVGPQYAGSAQVIALSGVKLGDTYKFPLYASAATEVDTGSFVQRIRAEPIGEHDASGIVQWAVTIEYAPFDVVHWLGTSYISSGQVNPLDRALEVFWDAAKYEYSKPEDESETPKPYVNTVGDPLLDVPSTEETRPVLKIVRNEPIYNDAYASQFKDTVNSDEFLGYPPNTVKCRDIRGEREYDPDWGYYWRVTYEFEFRDTEDGFGYKQRIINAGYRYKKGGTGDPINCVDGNGQQVNDAKFLQENGDLLPDGDDPYYLEFMEFPQVAFADLNIPDDILQQAS